MFIVFNSNLNNLLNLDSDKISQKPPALQDTYVKEGFSTFWLIMQILLALLFQ